jgi:D-alanine-D-alanine ligase
MKINKHIEIVRSSIASLSSMGQKSCNMIAELLSEHYEQVGISTVNDISDLDILIEKQPDLAFLGLKRVFSNSSLGRISKAPPWMAYHLERAGINYTGSKASAIASDFNKPMAKQIVGAAGLKTAAYFTAGDGQYRSAKELPLGFPLFIKPQNEGGGKGIGADSVVRDFKAYRQKVTTLTRDFHSDALVEVYLTGREFSVAILETPGSDELLVMPIELITEQNVDGDSILGHQIKDADTEQVVSVPEGVIRDNIIELASQVFRALGARDYGRVDMRLDQFGTLHFLEANLIPGLAFHSFTSYFTSACMIDQGMDYESMILHIVNLALSRDQDLEDIQDLVKTASALK